MLTPAAAPPAPIVIDVPSSTTRASARPMTDRDGTIVAYATRRDGNSVLITLPGGDAHDVGYATVHSGRVTQLVRGSQQPDVVLQRVTAGSTVIEGRHDAPPVVHVARPELILPTH